MLSKSQAKTKVEQFAPEVIPKASVRYKNLYLFRIESPTGDIVYDPFLSVDINTGAVQGFSVALNIDEISNLDWVEEA